LVRYSREQSARAHSESADLSRLQPRQAESGNHGLVPNPAFPHAFLAAAHDLGEPWDDGCKHAPHWCCTCMNITRDAACVAGVDSAFDPVTKYPWLIDVHAPCTSGARTTPQLMGGVHPSTKIHVGERLAQAAWSLHYDHPDEPWTGPVVAACGLEHDGASLRVEFNRSLLGGGGGDALLALRNYSRAEQASATFVRLGEPLPEDAWKNLLYVLSEGPPPLLGGRVPRASRRHFARVSGAAVGGPDRDVRSTGRGLRFFVLSPQWIIHPGVRLFVPHFSPLCVTLPPFLFFFVWAPCTSKNPVWMAPSQLYNI
jgi:hypothetical protein